MYRNKFDFTIITRKIRNKINLHFTYSSQIIIRPHYMTILYKYSTLRIIDFFLIQLLVVF